MFNLLVHNYLTRGFWGDEAWTIGISRLPIKEIISITSQDFHPPFYYFLVHYLGLATGYTEIPIRLLSTFFAILISFIVYQLCKLFWTSKSKKTNIYYLASSVLVLFSPILFTYAFEARSYGLLAFESILSAYIFWRAQSEIKGRYLWRTLYFVVGGIMVYTHYYAWFILAGHAFYLLLFARKHILPMLTSALGILLVQLPWLPTLLGQTSSVKSSYWIAPINSTTHIEFFLRVTGGDVVTSMQKPLAYVIGGILFLDFLRRLRRRDFPAHYCFLMTWLLIPTLIPTLLSLALAPIFFYRYLIFSAIPILILTVQALKDLPRTLFLTLLVLIAGSELYVDYYIFSQCPLSMREEVTNLQHINPSLSSVYTVLPSFAEVAYYLNSSKPIQVLPEGLVQFSGKSLLDAYVRLGKAEIVEGAPPYYLLEPGPKTTIVE
ncbi:MAG: glycosyltransferase family 39 protein [bacterium]